MSAPMRHPGTGDNGWTDPFGKKHALRLLNDLRGVPSMAADFIASYMIGKGRSGGGCDARCTR